MLRAPLYKLSFLLRRDHVQEHHGGQPRAHEGGHPQRDAQTRPRRVAGELHLVAASPGQRLVLWLQGATWLSGSSQSQLPGFKSLLRSFLNCWCCRVSTWDCLSLKSIRLKLFVVWLKIDDGRVFSGLGRFHNWYLMSSRILSWLQIDCLETSPCSVYLLRALQLASELINSPLQIRLTVKNNHLVQGSGIFVLKKEYICRACSGLAIDYCKLVFDKC